VGDVITLDGLDSTTLSGTKCGKLVSINAPMLGQSVQVCETDVSRMAGLAGVKRRPGRPKNTTVKNGARKPRFKGCGSTKVVKTKKGKKICKCADRGNGQILPHKSCGLGKPTKRSR